jgi:hypothetical protein
MSMVPAQDVADTFRLLRLPYIHIENSVSSTCLFQVRRCITFLFCSSHECTSETRDSRYSTQRLIIEAEGQTCTQNKSV